VLGKHGVQIIEDESFESLTFINRYSLLLHGLLQHEHLFLFANVFNEE